MTNEEAIRIDREIGEATGVFMGRNRIMQLGHETALAEAMKVSSRNKKRAGVKGLVHKYGQSAASNIVSKHAGRRINVRG